MAKLRNVLLGILLAALPCVGRGISPGGISPESRAHILPADRAVGLAAPAVIAHVRFVQVTEQGDEVPGGEHRDATLVLYLDSAESDGAAAPAGLATPDLRGFTWYLVANYASQGSGCDPVQPSILLLSNATFSVDCPNQDATPGN